MCVAMNWCLFQLLYGDTTVQEKSPTTLSDEAFLHNPHRVMGLDGLICRAVFFKSI